MYVKIHKSEHQKVIAICDEGLIGKTISEGDKEINISEDFYKGDLLKEEQVLELLKDARVKFCPTSTNLLEINTNSITKPKYN